MAENAKKSIVADTMRICAAGLVLQWLSGAPQWRHRVEIDLEIQGDDAIDAFNHFVAKLEKQAKPPRSLGDC